MHACMHTSVIRPALAATKIINLVSTPESLTQYIDVSIIALASYVASQSPLSGSLGR